MQTPRFVLACVLALSPALAAAQGSCSKADAGKAEKAIDRVSTWPQMHKAFKDFRQCDDGQVSELYTETFIRLLVDWKNVDQLVDASKDAEFKAFMFKHLQSPAAADDAGSVYSRAKANCPSGHKDFCDELAGVTKPAGKAAPAQAMQPLQPLQPIGPKK